MAAKFNVLAAIDLHPGSTPVFERAVALASVHPDGEVHVVTVAEPQVPLMVYPGFLPPPELRGVDAEEVAAFCRDRLRTFHEANPEARLPHVHVHTSVGKPADEIVWLAAHLDADWIVIATHSRRGIKRLLMGSVADKVVRLAGCPVMVIREKNHNPAWKVPEIEPLCPDCAEVRKETNGEQLWCARHSERHVRMHVLHYTPEGEVVPRAWSSSTGI
ncbi:MAG: universal stress protein [Polyangiaceae bacterium]|nr:universal stress protein [Polyangiaceae bacterium]